MSRTPIREALNDLARVGLIEMAPQRYTRVAVPSPADRVAIMQTLGAVVGGVVRVTTPTLSTVQRKAIVKQIDTVLETLGRWDLDALTRAEWAVVEGFIGACPNPVLVSATKDTVQGLMYRASVTRDAAVVEWADLGVQFPLLREAVLGNDAVGAELAIEHVFHL